MSAELKPCPFCGGEAILDSHHIFSVERWSVHCHENFKTCPVAPWLRDTYADEDAAILAWNTRRSAGLR